MLAFGCVALSGAPAPASPPGGYWLSAEFAGDAGAQVQAASEMAGNSERVFMLDPAAVLPGESVARVQHVQDALSWVARWAFDSSLGWPEQAGPLRLASAPRIGGSLFSRFGVRLRSLVVTGATPSDGVREIAWPIDQRQALPADLDWRPAALLPTHAALFAAPAASLPPATHRSGQAMRAGGMFLLGRIDRCEQVGGQRHCMRWVQVIAREQDRFSPGYLPNFQVAEIDAWTRAPGGLPRAQLRASNIAGEQANYLLTVRLKDNQLHQVVVTQPAVDQGFDEFDLEFDGEVLVLRSRAKGTQVAVQLNAHMDMRPRPAARPTPAPATVSDQGAAAGDGAAPPASVTAKP